MADALREALEHKGIQIFLYIKTERCGFAGSVFYLPLLYWASEAIADPRYRHIAELHADMVLKEFMQEDG
ncbi:hypothetical protein GCM10010911_19080 [Paenibacillus nasutitermitis]|uniref:Uncharacterized protein n=1 Tax=Paenibacillus nasutitermitis TaxID=1652958 RepID=A0A916YUS3_9BACL|nr:hypothetical protein GCM10010911_19080 [Paenibacillus nasutitermitis]